MFEESLCCEYFVSTIESIFRNKDPHIDYYMDSAILVPNASA